MGVGITDAGWVPMSAYINPCETWQERGTVLHANTSLLVLWVLENSGGDGGTTSACTWPVPLPKARRNPRGPVACDQSLLLISSTPENSFDKWFHMSVYSCRTTWCRIFWQYSSPVWATTKGWCGTPHLLRLTNWAIIPKMYLWKFLIESAYLKRLQPPTILISTTCERKPEK